MAKNQAAKQGDFLADLKSIRGGRTSASDHFIWQNNCVTKPKIDEAFPGANLKKATGPETTTQAPEQLSTTNKGQLDVAKIRSELSKEIKTSKSGAKHLRGK